SGASATGSGSEKVITSATLALGSNSRPPVTEIMTPRMSRWVFMLADPPPPGSGPGLIDQARQVRRHRRGGAFGDYRLRRRRVETGARVLGRDPGASAAPGPGPRPPGGGRTAE